MEPKPELHIVEPLNRLDQADFDLFLPALRNAQETSRNHAAALGALSYVMKHLAPKYQMVEGDDINADGVIIRKSK